MGKRKVKDSENQDNSRGKLKTNNHGIATGKILKPVEDLKPQTKCSTVVISVILVATLSIFLGLILVELNVSNKDIKDDLFDYHYSSFEKKSHEELKKVPNNSEDIEDPIEDPTTQTPSTRVPDSRRSSKSEQMEDYTPAPGYSEEDRVTDHLPPPKRVRKEEDTKVERKLPQDIKGESAAKLSEEKVREIEKHIVTDELPTPKTSPLTTQTTAEAKEPTVDVEETRKRDSPSVPSGRPAVLPSKESKDESKSVSEDKPTAEVSEKKAEVDLLSLYMEVESLSEEILKEEPENEMVKQLGPHLESVVRDLEKGKVSGLQDSLLHIKVILLDLKGILAESKSKPVDASRVTSSFSEADVSGKKDESGRIPVDEVIPDPVYIAPRGDKKSSSQRPAAETGLRDKERESQTGRVAEEIKPNEISGKEDTQVPKEASEKANQKPIEKREASESKKPSDEVILEEKAATKVSETDKQKSETKTPKVGKLKEEKNDKKKIQSQKISDGVTQKESAEKRTSQPEKIPDQIKKKKSAEKMVPESARAPEQAKQTGGDKIVSKVEVKQQKESPEKNVPHTEKTPQKTAGHVKQKVSDEKIAPKVEKTSQKVNKKETAEKVLAKEKAAEAVKPHDVKVEQKQEADVKVSAGKVEGPPEAPNSAPLKDQRQEPAPRTASLATERPPGRQAAEPHSHSAHQKTETSESEVDDRFEAKLKSAESLADERPLEALNIYEALMRERAKCPRVLLGWAKALVTLSQIEKSNPRLEEAIRAYTNIIDLADESASLVPKDILREAALGCSDKLEFRGWYNEGIELLRRVLVHFPDDVTFLNKMGIFFLSMHRIPQAKEIFEKVLKISPEDGSAMALYGFILKTLGETTEDFRKSLSYLERGLKSGAENVVSDSRFYYHAGSLYQRLGEDEKAYELYDIGVARGLFLSRYQRSMYNVDRLRSQPVWTPEETTYEKFFRKLQSHWKEIAQEGMKALALNKGSPSSSKLGFRDEAEKLRDTGQWAIYELFVRGKKVVDHCQVAPLTCSLIEAFPPAAQCTRGQTKFSVMTEGTHVVAHTGPTNCRLRAHLGLVTPKGAYMRVVNQTLEWEAGKLFIFDDSFDHEVWHEGKSIRLILIVDVWHPDLTLEEKRTLRPI